MTTKMFLTSCSTKSLSIQDAIHLHFPSWLADRGFHHVSLLVQEETQRNNPPVWRMHQSLTPCPTLTVQLGNNRSFIPPYRPVWTQAGLVLGGSNHVYLVIGIKNRMSNSRTLISKYLCVCLCVYCVILHVFNNHFLCHLKKIIDNLVCICS